MKDIELLEICPKCGHHIILMESVRMSDNKLCLVKRCLSCFGYKPIEVIEVSN